MRTTGSTRPGEAARADRIDRIDRTDGTVGLGPTRARVLAVLQDVGLASTAAELARRLGTHSNTARFHLEALAGAGLVERTTEDRAVPGRPRVRYAASTAAPPAAARSYRLLAEILTAHLAAQVPEPERFAAAAGAAFGRQSAAGCPTGSSTVSSTGSTAGVTGPGGRDPEDADPAGPAERADSVASAVAAVVQSLGEMGFESWPTFDAGDVRIDVTSCPFLEVATRHLPVVCAVHRGLMEGLLDELGAPVRVAGLEPLVEPGLCVAHLTATGA